MSDNEKWRVRNRAQIDGRDVTINSQTIEVILQDSLGLLLLCRGTSVPTADGAGYAKGCQFIKTDAGDGTKGLYENAGTTTACDFNLIGDISSAEIADGAITSAKMDSSLIRYTDVAVTATQVKALAATNIELVPATEAGAGFAIVPVAVSVKLDYGSEVLAESDDNFGIRYSAGAELMEIETTGLIDQTNDESRYQAMAEAAFVPVANTAIDLDNNGDGEITGNASNDTTVTFRTYYRVIPVL